MRRSTLTFLLASLITATVVGVFLVWTLLGLGGQGATVWLDDLGTWAAAWIGGGLCLVAAWRHHGRARLAWALMGASAFAWGAGEAVWCRYELGLGEQVPFPSLADLGYLGAVPLAVAGALAFPGAVQRRASRAAGAIDGLVIACGLLALSWVTVLRSVYEAGGDGLLAQVLSIAYPAGDVVIATILVTLTMRLSPGNRLPLLLVVAGLLGNAVADGSFAYLTANGTYGPGNALDTGWFAGYLLLALGAFRAAQCPARPAVTVQTRSRWSMLLPYVPLAMALAAGARQEAVDHTLEPFLFWLLFAIVGLVVMRQFLTLADNHALLRDLGAHEAEMRHRAFHDPLTDLANRALFVRRAELALQPVEIGGETQLAAIVLDLDDFKNVNDLLGHDCGDRVLMAVASRLRHSVRPTDTAARIGGDEFAILVEGLHEPGMIDDIAGRVVAALRHPVDLGSGSVPVQASLGVVHARSGELSVAELIRRADVAMYRAKSEGKDCYVMYHPEMDSTFAVATAASAEATA